MEDLNSMYTRIEPNVLLPYASQHMESDSARIVGGEELKGDMEMVSSSSFLSRPDRRCSKANADYAGG